MKNDNSYGPSVGDSYGYPQSGVYTAGQFQTGDYLCLFSGKIVSLTADIWSNVYFPISDYYFDDCNINNGFFVFTG